MPNLECDIRVVTIDRCSTRALAAVMRAILLTASEVLDTHAWDYRAALVDSSMTSAEVLVRIPRKMQRHNSATHATNFDFFTDIKGVDLSEQPKLQLNCGERT